MRLYHEWGVETPNIEEAYVIQIDSKEDYRTLTELEGEEKIRLHNRLWGNEKVLVFDENEGRFKDQTEILKAMAVVAHRLGVVVV